MQSKGINALSCLAYLQKDFFLAGVGDVNLYTKRLNNRKGSRVCKKGFSRKTKVKKCAI